MFIIIEVKVPLMILKSNFLKFELDDCQRVFIPTKVALWDS